MTIAAAATAPVQAAERMDVLDVLRGAAVLGILLVNVESFIGYGFLPASAAPPPGSASDALSVFLIEFLVQGKFYCLFSFLFGVGFAVFMQRASARGIDAVRLFRRRLFGLLLIGLIHSLLIWYGDILTTYALIGFGLIPFLRKDDRRVLRAAAVWLASPVFFYLLLMGIAALLPAPAAAPAGDGMPPFLAAAVQSFAHGNYPEVVRGNVLFTIANLVRRLVLMFFPRVFGMFLLGFYAGRANVFADLGAHVELLKRLCLSGLVVGLPLAFVGAKLGDSGSPRAPTWMGLLEMIVESIATPLLALAYGAAICLVFLRFKRLGSAIAPAGRMALTNYLSHSVAGVLIFYGLGAGFYGRLSYTYALIGCLAVFALQVAISRVWLSFALYGPAEWAWRTFTYRRRFPLFRG